MGSLRFCIFLLALSVTCAMCQECNIERNSEVLVVNCSRSSRSAFTIPDPLPYQGDKSVTSIVADYQYNNLQTITKFTFAKLRSLNLANNRINVIADGAFSKVDLYELDLSFNKITSISARQLMGLKELRSLSLYGNVISQLSPEVFSSLVSLEHLNLGRNFIQEQLDPALFSPLSALRELSLKENALSYVDPRSFQKQKFLEKLTLSENAIAQLDSKTFEFLYDLKHLDLSHNKFSVLDDMLFKSQQEIEYLDLSWNYLEYFGDKLKLSSSLKVVKIGHNSLHDVEISETLKGIKEIYVENNSLQNLQFLRPSDMLEIVNASSNNISAIEEGSYPYLHTLDLSNNSFASIPSLVTSRNLPALSHLHFDMNPIQSLKFPSSGERFQSLQLVSLSRMPHLKEVSKDSLDALRSTGSRQRRSDDNTNEEEEEDETTVPGNENETTDEEEAKDEIDATTVTEETGLQQESGSKVSGSDNEKSQEPEESAQVAATDETEDNEGAEGAEVNGDNEDTGAETRTQTDAVTDADSQGSTRNEENDQPEEEAPKMKTAMLRADPNIQEQDRTVVDDCSYGGIILDISHNENLAKIDDESFVGINICKLDLSYNALTSVPKEMARWDDLPSVDFQGNPWDCSCSLQWLLDTIVAKLYPSAGKQHLLYELRCASPVELRGRRFVHFYNWTEAAFCTKHGQMRLAPTPGDDTTGVTLHLGGSTGMFVGVGIAIGMIALLVGVAAWLHRSNTMKKRARNRRA